MQGVLITKSLIIFNVCVVADSVRIVLYSHSGSIRRELCGQHLPGPGVGLDLWARPGGGCPAQDGVRNPSDLPHLLQELKAGGMWVRSVLPPTQRQDAAAPGSSRSQCGLCAPGPGWGCDPRSPGCSCMELLNRGRNGEGPCPADPGEPRLIWRGPCADPGRARMMLRIPGKCRILLCHLKENTENSCPGKAALGEGNCGELFGSPTESLCSVQGQSCSSCKLLWL